jgi:hypothetical protein
MSIELLAFFFGILLLFVAIVGGGFEVRELKVPRVGRIARIVSAVAGVLFLTLGFSGTTVPEVGGSPVAHADTPIQAPKEPNATPPSPVDFTIQDELGELQITEQITVHIDGRMVGTLTVDAVHPTSTVTVTVPEPGRYNYTLESSTTFDLENGPTEIPGHGRGQIDVKDGSAFSVFYDIGETELSLELREAP